MLPAYISKHKLACEKQIIFFMIPNEEKKKDGIILQYKNYLDYYIEKLQKLTVIFIV